MGIMGARTQIECRAYIGLVCMGATYLPPYQKWDWLVSPWSTPRSRATAFQEIAPHLREDDRNLLTSLLERLERAVEKGE